MTRRILYLDPWTGISGDMLLGALLDTDRGSARLPQILEHTVAALGLDDGVVETVRSVERGVSCTRLLVHGEDTPPLRHLADMEQMVRQAGLPSRVEERSVTALRRLAQVEADVHGCGVDHIHFHEVGAVDTLVDVVGTFALVEALDIEAVAVGPIPVGGGTVEIAHGRMGVPAPATVRLLSGYPVVGGPETRELTTPTGALLVACLEARPQPLPALLIESVGYGAGSMQLDCGPNVLRVMVGEEAGADRTSLSSRRIEAVLELVTNLDDATPEMVAHASRLLRDAGALDVWTEYAGGKKDRPVLVLHALLTPDREAAVLDLMFGETGTLGVRRSALSRWVADRGSVAVGVRGGEVAVKWGRWGGRLTSLAPEYEEAAAVAAQAGTPLKTVMHEAIEAARELLQQEGA